MSETSPSEWRTKWLRGGKISEVAWIGQDVMAWSSGLHIIFYNAATDTLKLPKFTDYNIENGISCISGHSRYDVCDK